MSQPGPCLPGFCLTRRPENPKLILETRPRGGLRAAPKALSLFFCAPRTARIRNQENCPALKDVSVPVTFAVILKVAQLVEKLEADFLSDRLAHSLGRQTKAPVHAVDAQIGRLHRPAAVFVPLTARAHRSLRAARRFTIPPQNVIHLPEVNW